VGARKNSRKSDLSRETWIVEIPAGYCHENTDNQKLWIETAIDAGATAIGVYQIAEKELYINTLLSIGAYGIMTGNGKIYYSDGAGMGDDDYYLMLAKLSGVQYDILNDDDPGARMISNAFGKMQLPWPL